MVAAVDGGPAGVLEDADVLGTTFGKKLSDVPTIGENLIFVCLAAFHASSNDSFSCLSPSELWAVSGLLNQLGST